MKLSLKSMLLPILLVLFNTFAATNGAKTVCLDTQADFLPSAWKFNTINYKYANSAADLPKSFGNLNFLDGNGIWYIEGTGTGSEIRMSSDPSLYNRARSVKIYLRYYDKSPRRISLQPIKSQTPGNSGPVMLLPLSTGNQWTEVTQEINPAQSPIEISAVLSQGQFILFELVVVAVDTSLPKNATAACMDFTVYANSNQQNPQQGISKTTTKAPLTKLTGPGSAAPAPSSNSCPANPPPTPVECKCNCNCNCSKQCD